MIKNETPKTNTSLEIAMKMFLTECGIDYEHQFAVHEMRGSWAFDFFIPSLHLLVEVDGEYHHTRSLKQFNRDRRKAMVASRNGYGFLRISDKDWRTELIFASESVRKDHTETLMARRAELFDHLIT